MNSKDQGSSLAGVLCQAAPSTYAFLSGLALTALSWVPLAFLSFLASSPTELQLWTARSSVLLFCGSVHFWALQTSVAFGCMQILRWMRRGKTQQAPVHFRGVVFRLLGPMVGILILAALAVPVPDGQAHPAWYWAGVIEIGRLPHPAWMIGAFGLLAATIYATSYYIGNKRNGPRLLLFIILAFYGTECIVGLWVRGADGNWGTPPPGAGLHFAPISSVAPDKSIQPNSVIQTSKGAPETCLGCHTGMTGLKPGHEAEQIGCSACHRGNPLSLNKTSAHQGLLLTPGNLSVAASSCGSKGCHEDIQARVAGSIMNTMSGVVSVDKWALGETPDPDGLWNIATLRHSPADQHLRGLCASCHLGTMKEAPGPLSESSRGGGCSACHLNYSKDAREFLRRKGAPVNSGLPQIHPEISSEVRNEACFGCHSRSGRISLNYEGWHELDPIKAAEVPDKNGRARRVLEDGRVLEKHQADLHFDRGMDCIDCHLSQELMGNGVLHQHKEEALQSACEDCHPTNQPETKNFAALPPETQRLVSRRQLNQPGREFLVGAKAGAVYPNVFTDSGDKLTLIGKRTGLKFSPKKTPSSCTGTQGGHRQVACNACHSSWVPQCYTCHSSYNKELPGWDLLDNKDMPSSWTEQAGDFRAERPILGRLGTNGKAAQELRLIGAFAPGMIQRTTGASEHSSQFKRLFAPVSGHTTNKEGRVCADCHLSSLALGYGHGKLEYAVTGQQGHWTFLSAAKTTPEDGLPEDAWTAFLKEPAPDTATRSTAAPLSLKQQQNMLLVGACLYCHPKPGPAVSVALTNFDTYRAAVKPQCILPEWVK